MRGNITSQFEVSILISFRISLELDIKKINLVVVFLMDWKEKRAQSKEISLEAILIVQV